MAPHLMATPPIIYVKDKCIIISFYYYTWIFEIRKKLRNFVMNFAITIEYLAILVYNIFRYTIYRGVRMEISYKKLWILLIEKEISPATLRKDLNIATGTMTKMRRNEEVALSVLLRICEYLDCNIGDICDAVRTDTE